MTIALEKILTITADEYAEMSRSGLTNYTPYAIHFMMESSEIVCSGGIEISTFTQEFASRVPDGAEVVVDYRMNIAASSIMRVVYAYGTALIPPKKDQPKDSEPVAEC